MSRDIPVLFSAPMVRANLAGTKTQTRRPLYVLTKGCASATMHRNYLPPAQLPPVDRCWTLSQWFKAKAGDRLWQRETWRRECPHPEDDTVCIAYAASQDADKGGTYVDNIPRPAAVDMATWQEEDKWRPSIHMPRWACRFTALITEVRIERLQAITEADAMAEGVERYHHGWEPYHQDTIPQGTARDSYACLWKLINGADSWKANPWIVAITYERIKP